MITIDDLRKFSDELERNDYACLAADKLRERRYYLSRWIDRDVARLRRLRDNPISAHDVALAFGDGDNWATLSTTIMLRAVTNRGGGRLGKTGEVAGAVLRLSYLRDEGQARVRFARARWTF